MRVRGWHLAFGIALLGAAVMAQEIVIEPTNGRAPTGHKASVPSSATPETPKPASHALTKPAEHTTHIRTEQRKLAKKASTGESAKSKVANPAEVKNTEGARADSAPAMAKNEGAETSPVSVKSPARPEWAMDDSRDAGSLQAEISGALARDPILQHSAIQVKVDSAAVTLEGRAESPQELLQAERLAKSYAWNRKLVNRIEVESSAAVRK